MTKPLSTLQDVLDSVPNLVDHFYSNRKGSPANDSVLRQPPPRVQPEYTSWRDEQTAWRNTVAFYNQSFHMISTVIRGKDTKALLQHLAVNNLDKFGVNMGIHYLACGPDGNVVGDGILFSEAEDEAELVGRAAGHKWLEYQVAIGNWDVTLHPDQIFSQTEGDRRRLFRFQLEGPNAIPLLEKLNGGALAEGPRSALIKINIGGKVVTAYKMAMAGGTGYEFWGPWDDGDAVKAAILEAGPEFGLRQVGSFAYFSNALESGWIPRPVHAIYTGEDMRGFREWLPADANEVKWSIGGSFASPNIEDYYFDPYELGYGYHVKFDHDFIGREALESKAGKPHRKRVTLLWNAEDVNKVTASYMDKDELPGLYINHPISNYANWQYDAVRNDAGETVGLAVYTGFSWNHRTMLSTAVLDAEYAEPGTEVSVIWGEPDGGAKSQPWLIPHRQMAIRATVVKAPLHRLK